MEEQSVVDIEVTINDHLDEERVIEPTISYVEKEVEDVVKEISFRRNKFKNNGLRGKSQISVFEEEIEIEAIGSGTDEERDDIADRSNEITPSRRVEVKAAANAAKKSKKEAAMRKLEKETSSTMDIRTEADVAMVDVTTAARIAMEEAAKNAEKEASMKRAEAAMKMAKALLETAVRLSDEEKQSVANNSVVESLILKQLDPKNNTMENAHGEKVEVREEGILVANKVVEKSAKVKSEDEVPLVKKLDEVLIKKEINVIEIARKEAEEEISMKSEEVFVVDAEGSRAETVQVEEENVDEKSDSDALVEESVDEKNSEKVTNVQTVEVVAKTGVKTVENPEKAARNNVEEDVTRKEVEVETTGGGGEREVEKITASSDGKNVGDEASIMPNQKDAVTEMEKEVASEIKVPETIDAEIREIVSRMQESDLTMDLHKSVDSGWKDKKSDICECIIL